jgi:hypothetical protein
MANTLIKVKYKPKPDSPAIDASEFYKKQPAELKKAGESENDFALRMSKEYPDMFSIEGTQEPPSVGGFVSNLLSDSWEGVKSIPALAGSIKDLAYTPVALYKGETSIPQIMQTGGNVLDSLKNQYSEYYGPLLSGDFQKFGSNVYEHPGQILGDIATVATGGELAAAKMGAKGVKVASTLGKVAAFTDPVTGPIKAVEAVANTTNKIPAVSRATRGLARWSAEQNIPTGILKDKEKAAVAKAQAAKNADTMLEHGITLTKSGEKKAEGIVDKIHSSRKDAVNALAQDKIKVEDILRPEIRGLLLDEANNVGTNPHNIAKTAIEQMEGETLGAKIITDKDGNILGDDPLVMGRDYDKTAQTQGSSGDFYRPTLKTPNDLMETIRNGNRALSELYEEINRSAGVESKTKLKAQKKIIEAYRAKLDDLVGDVPVTLIENGKPKIYKFKDLGIDESRLIDLGGLIHETVFNSNPFKALSPSSLVSTDGFFKALKNAVHSPGVASRIAVFVKGTNPSTFGKTRILSSGSRLNNTAENGKVQTEPPPSVENSDDPNTWWTK